MIGVATPAKKAGVVRMSLGAEPVAAPRAGGARGAVQRHLGRALRGERASRGEASLASDHFSAATVATPPPCRASCSRSACLLGETTVSVAPRFTPLSRRVAPSESACSDDDSM